MPPLFSRVLITSLSASALTTKQHSPCQLYPFARAIACALDNAALIGIHAGSLVEGRPMLPSSLHCPTEEIRRLHMIP